MIQRYAHYWDAEPPLPAENGKWVTYADHLDALRACEGRMLNAAREAVGSMEIAVAGNSAATVDQALAVISSLREASND
jgi:hypothetical protein